MAALRGEGELMIRNGMTRFFNQRSGALSLGFAALLLALVALPTLASAAPKLMQLEGVLLATGGSPAADGDYDLTFGLYAAGAGGAALWSEGPVKVTIAGGRFAYAMGSSKPIDAALLAAGDRFVGVQVGGDPELPRQPLRSVAYALVAESAMSLSCSGCVSGAGQRIGRGGEDRLQLRCELDQGRPGARSCVFGLRHGRRDGIRWRRRPRRQQHQGQERDLQR
jgi:hypothetical protein